MFGNKKLHARIAELEAENDKQCKLATHWEKAYSKLNEKYLAQGKELDSEKAKVDKLTEQLDKVLPCDHKKGLHCQSCEHAQKTVWEISNHIYDNYSFVSNRSSTHKREEVVCLLNVPCKQHVKKVVGNG